MIKIMNLGQIRGNTGDDIEEETDIKFCIIVNLNSLIN